MDFTFPAIALFLIGFVIWLARHKPFDMEAIQLKLLALLIGGSSLLYLIKLLR
jgi:hypothetical protein